MFETYIREKRRKRERREREKERKREREREREKRCEYFFPVTILIRGLPFTTLYI